jgi:hypothetical protein
VILSQLISGGTDVRALAQELEVPVVAGLQHQGDVSVVPASMAANYVRPRQAVPAAGISLVRGESDGNTHLLLASGNVLFDPIRKPDAFSEITRITLGCLLVGDDAEAYLDHPQHGNSGIAPGAYVLRRKREMAVEMRLVID